MSAGREAGEGAPGRTRTTADTKRDPSVEKMNRLKSSLLLQLLLIQPKQEAHLRSLPSTEIIFDFTE